MVALCLCGEPFLLTRLSVDHALERLSPSLKRHERCDIIDINPGVGLWSSKLHEHIKPRSHILVEPLYGYYRPFLEPLLEQTDSKYRLADIKGLGLPSYESILGQGVLPLQKILTPNESDSSNNSLLLVANIAYPPRASHQKSLAPAQRWVHHFLGTIRDQSGFHVYGRVRLLLWTLDEGKSAILPRSVANRQKLAVEAEVCSVTEEVAGADAAAGSDRRVLSLDIQSAKRVAQAMEDQNVKIPKGREAVLHKMVTDISDQGEPTEPVRVSNHGLRKWHDELETLKRDFEKGVFTEFVDQSTPLTSLANPAETNKGRTKHSPKRPKTPQWTRMNTLINSITSQGNKDKMAEDIAMEQMEIDARQDALEDPELSEDERSWKRKEIEDMITQLQKRLEGGVKGFAKKVTFFVDDRRAVQQSPPLLQWDRRSAEPLVVHDAEFHPRLPLALLDIQPKPAKTAPNFELLLTSIFKRPTQPIGKTLDSLAPGAADALIPAIRGLRSRVNPRDYSTRMLSTEMIDDLLNAWEKWPFRPSSAKLWSTSGQVLEDKLELNKHK